MPGLIKKKKPGVDSSIGDAMKKIKDEKKKKKNMLEQAGQASNDLDVLNDRLNNGSEPESIRKIFEA